MLLAQTSTGTFTARGLVGSIGQNLMRPFRVVLDFGGARVAFIPKD